METDYLWYALLAFGLVVIPYLRKTPFKSAGIYIGISSVISAIGGLISSGFGVDGRVYDVIWIAYGFFLVGGVYVAFRTPRALIFLIFPIYELFPALIFPLPFVVLFAGLTLEFGVLEAYDFSRVKIVCLMRIARGERRFGILLTPFSKLGLFVASLLDQKPSRSLTFLSYSLFPCCLIVAVLVTWASIAQVGAYSLLAAVFVYLVIARNEFAKGLDSLSSESRGPSSFAVE